MRLHHIGIASNNIQEAIERHKALFGLRQVTSVVEDPVHKVSAVLLSDPRGVFIELIAPLTDDSPVSNILKKGISLYHVCYLVENLDETLKKIRRKAVVISKPAPAKLYGGRRVAFVYTLDNYVVEFLEEKIRDA